MINPEELYKLYGDFIAEAEFEFDDEAECFIWCNVNDYFLKWLAEENKFRAAVDRHTSIDSGDGAAVNNMLEAFRA